MQQEIPAYHHQDDIRELLQFSLGQDNYRIDSIDSGNAAWKKLKNTGYDLVLLDWMLPDTSGIELLQRIRRDEQLKELRVIMLTARSDESDRVRGLDNGADDYVVKPFLLNELRARIRTRLRPHEHGTFNTLSVGGVVMNQESHRTRIGENTIDLGPTEFRLLKHFMSKPDRVFSRSQLLDAVWGTNVYIEERTVDVHIRRLRKTLEPYKKANLIQTIRGSGYRFSDRY
jgi:two-component system phosphate regulon response regulator PhoB